MQDKKYPKLNLSMLFKVESAIGAFASWPTVDLSHSISFAIDWKLLLPLHFFEKCGTSTWWWSPGIQNWLLTTYHYFAVTMEQTLETQLWLWCLTYRPQWSYCSYSTHSHGRVSTTSSSTSNSRSHWTDIISRLCSCGHRFRMQDHNDCYPPNSSTFTSAWCFQIRLTKGVNSLLNHSKFVALCCLLPNRDTHENAICVLYLFHGCISSNLSMLGSSLSPFTDHRIYLYSTLVLLTWIDLFCPCPQQLSQFSMLDVDCIVLWVVSGPQLPPIML